MENLFYTSEKNTQILIALLKEHGIRKIVVSPGATNVCLVGSLQQDSYFEIYSSVDERSAAYIACGMAAESGEPVALSCTGATASRNYMPGLTEAYYRKLPVLAITSAQHSGRIGHNFPQVIDRTTPLNDIVKLSVQMPITYSEEDEWSCGVKLNQALLELRRNGGGPVHINLTTGFSKEFSCKELPNVKVIQRITENDNMPVITGKIAVFVGSHQKWSRKLTESVEKFCEIYNAVVLCDHTSNYQGRYGILSNLVCYQEQYVSNHRFYDLVIDIGNVSGGYVNIKVQDVWRVNIDGEIRDSFRKMTKIFEMTEEHFFEYYINDLSKANNTSNYDSFKAEYDELVKVIPELPFSNLWIAQHAKGSIPANSVMHFGILNSLRSWNFFEIDKSILCYSNTGGFGIDGCTSSLIGASLASPEKLFFGFVGDLSFFYDMNSLGNRHVGKNIRLMVINNGVGTEFRNYNHPAARFSDETNKYMAAAGHFGNKSTELLKHYVQDLGFEYMKASTKEEFLVNAERFFSTACYDRTMVFEIFTDSSDESQALYIMNNLKSNSVGNMKNLAKKVLGKSGTEKLKKIIQR